MLGVYTLLPLLKGWEYKFHQFSRTVGRGQSVKAGVSEKGWLLSIVTITDDAYGRVRLLWQGADLETKELSFTPEDFRVGGSFAQDPAGWAQRYFRPNPNSTAGIYCVAFSMYAEGNVLPYVPTVVMEVSLDALSTQSVATVNLWVATIAITDAEAFIKSLRRVLDAKADLWIDPALLALGSVEFKEFKEEK